MAARSQSIESQWDVPERSLVRTIANLAADNLRTEIADRLSSTQIHFALHEEGADLIVPGHRPLTWAMTPLARHKGKTSALAIYEETTTIVLSYLIDRFNARVFFDIGAGVGYFSNIAATHSRVPVSVHAFEMCPDRFSKLEATIAKEGLSNRVTSLLAGITDTHKGDVEMWYARGMLFESRPDPSEIREAWWRRLKFALRGDTSRQLRSANALVTSLDHYTDETGVSPDIIKIDVEGYEGRVLKGGMETFSTRRPFILLELHKDKKLRFGLHRQDVVQQLFDIGYQALFFTDHQQRRTCNIIAVGADDPLFARQETDLILFFHRDYLKERQRANPAVAIS